MAVVKNKGSIVLLFGHKDTNTSKSEAEMMSQGKMQCIIDLCLPTSQIH